MQKQNDVFYIQEAFKKLQFLNEDSFNLQDVGVVDELTSFVADDKDAPWIEEIIDVESDFTDELQDSYVGKVILQCKCCNAKIYKDASEVFVNEEDECANVEEECPLCGNAYGWSVIGKIEPYNEEEFKEEEPVEADLELDLTDDEINEALKKSISEDLDIHVQQDENGNVEEVIIEKEPEDNVVIDDESPKLPADEVVVDVDESCHSKLKEEVDIKVDSTPEGELIAEVGVDEGEHVEVVDKEEVELPAEDIEVVDEIPVEEGCHNKLKEAWATTYVDVDDEDDCTIEYNVYWYDITEGKKPRGNVTETFYKAKDALKYLKSLDSFKWRWGWEPRVSVEPEYGYIFDDERFNREVDKLIKYLKHRQIEIARGDVNLDESLNNEPQELESVNIDAENASDDAEKLENPEEDPVLDEPNAVEELKAPVDLIEGVENLSLDTEDTHMEMTSDENGKVVVMTEPRKEVEEVVEVDNEMIAPLSDEEKEDILNNEEIVDEPVEDEFEIDEFEEETFNELGESFLKRVYENVNSFKTSSVAYKKGRLVVEGLIKFNSGKEKSTSFIFEKFKNTKRNKVVVTGLNETFSKSKSAFMLKGDLKNKKFISESLIYNYSTHSLNESNKQEAVKVYGRAIVRNK